MKTESEFLGKPVEYWLEIEKEVNSCVIDSDLFKRIIIENYRLKCENNKLTERINLVKSLWEMGKDEDRTGN